MPRQPPQQQQQPGLAQECPSCKQSMKLVGRESYSGSSSADLLTFQCDHCGQIFTAPTNQ